MPFLELQLPSTAPPFVGLTGARLAIAIVATSHILVSGLISGAGQLAPAIEWLGYMRRRPHYDRLAHGLARFMIYYFGLSSTVAILFITVLLTGLWGHFWTALVRVTWWPMFLEAWTFVLEVSFAYLWYYTWGPLRGHKGLHMALGGLLAVASFLQVFMINIVASYMLTPTNPENPLRVVLNPTLYPLQVHRIVGNLAYVGFAFAGFSAIKYLRSRTPEDRAFYDWAGSFGLLWGTCMTLVQPVVGYSYAKEIQLHTYGSWYKMMMGSLSPWFLWQIFLLGTMFFVAALYFTRRLRTSQAPGAGLLRAMAAALFLTTLFGALPHHLAFTLDQVQAAGLDRPFWQGGLINPLGAMIPYKVMALMAFTLLSMAAVVWYLRGLPGVQWGTARRPEQYVLMLSAVLTMVMIATMGYIRENGRFPDLIVGQIQIEHQQNIPTPSPSPAPSP